MSEQWTVENDTGAELTVRAPNGFAVELDANSADPRERFAYFAIRQQSSDLDQLRAELAAAVAERDEWAGGAARLSSQLGNLLAVIHRDGGHYESEHGTEKACADAETAVHVQRGIADGYHDALKIWRLRAEQAEARLAAIDNAPTVAIADSEYHVGVVPLDGVWSLPIGTELIARPAKE